MRIDCTYNRRIRIHGNDAEMRGHSLYVYDHETGKAITHVKSIHVYLDAELLNYADVTFYETDEEGHLLKGENGPILTTIRTPTPEVAVSAWAKGVADEQCY